VNTRNFQLDTQEFTLVAVELTEGRWAVNVVRTNHAVASRQQVRTFSEVTFPTPKEALDHAECFARALTLEEPQRQFLDPIGSLK
jgi:hypothetical protein